MTHPKLPTVGSPVPLASSFETSLDGNIGLGVYLQDQTTPILSVPFLFRKSTATLAANTVVDSRTVDVTGHTIIVGDTIELTNTVTFMKAKVLSITLDGGGAGVDRLTLDVLVNHIYITTGTSITVGTENLLVDGSVTPVIFSVSPEAGQAGDFTAIYFAWQSAAVMDFSTFGGRTNLTNGILLRTKDRFGEYRNVASFKSNEEVSSHIRLYVFLVPKGGNTNYAFTADIVFSGQDNRGVVLRVNGNFNEEIQLVVQDDLTTGNASFRVLAHGHELQTAPNQ